MEGMVHSRITGLTALCIALATGSSNAQIVSGSASMTLSGQATTAATAQVEMKAIKKLKSELLQWLDDAAEISIDTANPASRLSFEMFLDTCRSAAKMESTFKGKELTVSYLLTGDLVREKVNSFNAMVDERAVSAWRQLLDARTSNNTALMYTRGLTCLFYALAHLGPPLATPDGDGGNLVDDCRQIVQTIFDKMSVKSSGPILAGKTGLALENPPTITLLLDSLPFPGIVYTGRLQNGAILFSATADDDGVILVDSFKIPFVPNGTLFDIGPNVAPVLGFPGLIDPTNLGIRLEKGQVQSFIFKIAKTTYTLDYSATSVNNITMPPDFASPAHVNKFLRDSCFLKETTGTEPADLKISIKAQVSNYTYDETEETGIKVTAQIIVKGMFLQPPKTNQKQMEFERRFGMFTTPAYGLYFWEANAKLREAIKATIAGL
jgi:hypothetical protein